MPLPILSKTVDWMEAIYTSPDLIDVTFHGGEPLLVGWRWYRQALPLLRNRFGSRLRLSIQSNLWLLDENYCAMFKEYEVSLGTSLDGPQKINDAQRGSGYFQRTMKGIAVARRNGLNVGVICTFTKDSAPKYKEVLDFFIDHNIDFSIHEALHSFGSKDSKYTLSPENSLYFMKHLFDEYLSNVQRIQISTFDAMAQGIAYGKGSVCTFSDCLGRYLTITPEGCIFPCNRFACNPEWQLGSILDRPTKEALSCSRAWKKLGARKENRNCDNCPHHAYCMGGCLYNSIVAGEAKGDPNCRAYKGLFDHMTDTAMKEVFSSNNIAAVVAKGTDGKGLMHQGPLLTIMRKGAHPKKEARRSRKLIAAAALAVSTSPRKALIRLQRAGAITHPEAALGSLRLMHRKLKNKNRELLNAYLHVTNSCNLSCSHCYANSYAIENDSWLKISDISILIGKISAAGFRKVIITGGEPLTHPHLEELCAVLAAVGRANANRVQIVMRTNLSLKLESRMLAMIADCVHHIIVSVDGDLDYHDARRGKGSYERTVHNLNRLLAVRPSAKVSVAATLPSYLAKGRQGDAVRALGKKLGVQTRFRPVLPLGRAQATAVEPEFDDMQFNQGSGLSDDKGPMSTCGLGMNICIGSDGECHPCYALSQNEHRLGNVFKEDFDSIIIKNRSYQHFDVDSHRQCRLCSFRYICGGFCRAWSSPVNPNLSSINCKSLKERAQKLLQEALANVGVDPCLWETEGLPWK